ncbi:methyltransferase domain-containing protein [Sporichthya polymorpha]|uniref:methyltransferase domain-containing protein n=1 Tax=Sporichthya polymorpha TaxID=35751 RepID=UPI0012EBBE00|nr:methyltransferase domain-containing protein [Sporichthya polymorpha]
MSEAAWGPTESAWTPGVLSRYDRALWDGAPLRVRDAHGAVLPFDVARWLREPDEADETLLARCTGPTLDIGCGPGRLAAALAARGVPALGVDVATAAVAIARSCGAAVLRRSVFDRLPGSGRWEVALLADGNIGIGGNVGQLLTRVRELVVPGGTALIEVADRDGMTEYTAVVADADGATVATFPWAQLGALALIDLAVPQGFRTLDRWTRHDRHFVALERR